MSEWQPIESAPRDGTKVLCFAPGKKRPVYAMDKVATTQVDFVKVSINKWWAERPDNAYTHWMLLPAPPKER